jgi:hypothetical protein
VNNLGGGLRFCFLIVAVFFSACDWQMKDQVSSAQYSSYSEAVQADAVAKGWIPSFLPQSAKNIIEWHNVETDRTRVEFSFDTKNDRQWIEQSFTLITNAQTAKLKQELLVSRGASINSKGTIQFFELTKIQGERGFLAVNHEQERAQYWSRSR